MVEYKGYIENIRFKNEANGYTVFDLSTDSGEITCIGILPAADIGESLLVSGEMVVHPVFGEQLKISSWKQVTIDDLTSFRRFLGSGSVKGIGEKLASRIIEMFGEKSPHILSKEPERLAEVKGISLKKAREIGVIYKEKMDFKEAFIFLTGYGLSNNMAILVYDRYGDEIYRIMKENPYRLAEDIKGIGFKKADEIASKIGIKADSSYRIACGLLYEAREASLDGHVYLPLNELLSRTARLLDIDTDYIMEGVENLAAERKLVIRSNDENEPHVYVSENYYTEVKCAALLRDLKSTVQMTFAGTTGAIDSKLALLEREMGIVFDDLQMEAVHAAATESIVIVTGGPGTGKTTTIRAMIRYFTDAGMDIMLAAPTGRAAKRMTEATGYEAKTIHRLLEVSSGPENEGWRARFERNEDNPLETDVVILDEMSMVDMFIFRALLCALIPGTKLIMVGDMDQLPSVGPGQVLRDLCESGAFRVVRLNAIFRQAMDSEIVIGAHEVRNGRYPALDNKGSDLFFISRDRSTSICERVIHFMTGKDSTFSDYTGVGVFDMQVLTPMRRGDLGVENLNRILQEHINPPSPDKEEIETGDTTFRTGDKVMQIKNDYQAEWEVVGNYNIVVEKGEGIFNGDLGKIIDIDRDDRIVTVEFDEGRRVEYDYIHLEELELAYAITIHKSQGSEYPVVILPLLSGPVQLMNRNLLYTAITRARKCVVIIGSKDAVYSMVDNASVNLRYTGLAARIKEVMGITDE